MGHSDLAVEHDEGYGHGPDDGNGSRVVPGDLGRDDDRDDVSRDSHDEPGFRTGPTRPAHRLASPCGYLDLRGRVPAGLGALRRVRVSRCARRLGVGRADPLDHDERGPGWWRHPGAGRALPAYTPQTGLPGKMLHASGFHPWDLAFRLHGCLSDGPGARHVLPGIELAALCAPLPPGHHECRSDGRAYRCDLRRKNVSSMGAHCSGSGPGPDPLWHARDCRACYTLAEQRWDVVEKTTEIL